MSLVHHPYAKECIYRRVLCKRVHIHKSHMHSTRQATMSLTPLQELANGSEENAAAQSLVNRRLVIERDVQRTLKKSKEELLQQDPAFQVSMCVCVLCICISKDGNFSSKSDDSWYVV